MRLVIKSGTAAGREFEVEREMTLGRAPNSDIVIADTGVSSHHARLRPAPGGIEVTDLGSTNGTYADGERFSGPRVVRPGEVLHFSNTETAVAASVQANATVAGATAPRLLVRTGPNAGQEASLAGGAVVVIGRARDAGLQLTDPRVSERNARVRLVGDMLEVSDLGSANGTLLNGEHVVGLRRAPAGAEIQVGDSVVSFIVGAFDPGQLANPTVIGRSSGANDSSIQRRVEAVFARRSRRLTVIASIFGVVAVGALSLGIWALFSGGGSVSADEAVARVAQDLAPATVRVLIVSGGEVISSGSGTIIDLEKGLIITNNHVAGVGQAQVTNTLFDQPLQATLVGTSYCDDLAILRVDGLKDKVKGLKQIKLGDAAALQQGQRVVTLGYPTAATPFDQSDLSVTSGVISKTRTIWDQPNTPRHDNVIQTDATINPGNSGGPLVNLKGEQIGVNTYGLAQAGIQQSNYAISIGRVREILPTLQAGKSPKWIGARFVEVASQGRGVGLAVDTLYPGGIAEDAGILPVQPNGSVPMYITEINGRPVRTVADYCAATPDEGKVAFTLEVNGPQTVSLDVGKTTQAK